MDRRLRDMKKKALGFSLLEVLVALALLSISFVSLILVQARATRLAVEARDISTATGLARYQLMECKREAQKKISSVGDYEQHGDFADLGFPKFAWECHAPKFNMKTPSATATEDKLKKGLGEKKEKGAHENIGIKSDLVSPVMAMVTSTLGDSVRELAVIVRYKEGTIADEVRVVTHVIDLAAMTGLARMISQGAQSLGGSPSKEKPSGPAPVPQGPPPLHNLPGGGP